MTTEPRPEHASGRIDLKSKWHGSEKLRFLLVGAYNTAFGYLAFAGLYLLLHPRVHYLGILAIAHVLAVLNAFIGHKFLTFRAEGHLIGDFLRFNLTYLGALALGLLGLPFLVAVCHIHPLISQAGLVLVSMVGTYLLHKKLSFRRG